MIDISEAASLAASPIAVHDMEPIQDQAEEVEKREGQSAAEGWLGAEITVALQMRETKKTEDTLPHAAASPAMEASPTPTTSAVSSSLGTELAAAFGKTITASERQFSGIGDATVSTPPSRPKTTIGGGLENEILATVGYKPTFPAATQGEVATVKGFPPAQPTQGEVADSHRICVYGTLQS